MNSSWLFKFLLTMCVLTLPPIQFRNLIFKYFYSICVITEGIGVLVRYIGKRRITIKKFS